MTRHGNPSVRRVHLPNEICHADGFELAAEGRLISDGGENGICSVRPKVGRNDPCPADRARNSRSAVALVGQRFEVTGAPKAQPDSGLISWDACFWVPPIDGT